MTEQSRTRSLSRRLADLVSHGPAYVTLVVISIFWLLPSLGLLVSSLRSAATNQERGWWTVLTDWDWGQLTLEPYANLLRTPAFVDAFLNTFLIAVPATLLVVMVASLAGFAFSWVEWRGRDVTFLIVIGLLVVPLQVGLIPIADLYGRLRIFGSIPGVVIYHLGFGLPFAIFLMRNFFSAIPAELLEAARIDGASELGLFFRVVLPLGVPAVASLMIFQFLWTWNDLLIALVFAGPNSQPLTVFIQQQTRQFGTSIDVIAPGAFVTMLVPLAVFFAFQRYFTQGLLAGAGK